MVTSLFPPVLPIMCNSVSLMTAIQPQDMAYFFFFFLNPSIQHPDNSNALLLWCLYFSMPGNLYPHSPLDT